MHGISRCIAVLGPHTAPLLRTAVLGNCNLPVCCGNLTCSLESAQKGGKLIIIVVSESALHRFNVTAEFRIKSIHIVALCPCLFSPGQIGVGNQRAGTGRFPSPGCPFVPPRHQNHIRIHLFGTFHLLRKQKSERCGVQMKLKFVPLSVRQDSQCRLFILYGIAAPDGKVGKNSRGNGHFFHFAGLRVIGNHLRSLAHPAPIILSVTEIFLQSPATPHGKFLAALRVDCREISENQGFSPVDYVQVAVLIVGINLIPKIVKHLNIRIRAVTEEKANIRGIHPFFTHSPVFPENCFINVGERLSVCHIKVNKIHTDVCEHGSVFANDPTVCGKIITEIGFCPIMCPTQRAAGNRFLKCLRTSLCINSIVIIQELVRIGRVGRRMPDLIKNTDQFVCNSGSVTAHIPPCPVGCRPCITVKITDANGIRFRVRNTHFLLPLQR